MGNRRTGGAPGWVLAFAVSLFGGAWSPLEAEWPQELAVSAGRFGVLRGQEDVEANWELRFAPRTFRLLPDRLPPVSPVGGVMATSQGTLYLYGGLRTGFLLGDRWALSPSFAAGLYYTGEGGRDLDGALEFRSGLELSRFLPNGARLGLALYHISNGGIYNRNPGSESLVLTYSAGLWRQRR